MATNADSRRCDLAVWQKRTSKPLTEEDGREIRHNLTGFFNVLREWAAAEKRPTNDNTTRRKNDHET